MLVSLNAMRVGLLTRLLGVARHRHRRVLRPADPAAVAPMVQILLPASLALLLFGFWPGGDPAGVGDRPGRAVAARRRRAARAARRSPRPPRRRRPRRLRAPSRARRKRKKR